MARSKSSENQTIGETNTSDLLSYSGYKIHINNYIGNVIAAINEREINCSETKGSESGLVEEEEEPDLSKLLYTEY